MPFPFSIKALNDALYNSYNLASLCSVMLSACAGIEGFEVLTFQTAVYCTL